MNAGIAVIVLVTTVGVSARAESFVWPAVYFAGNMATNKSSESKESYGTGLELGLSMTSPQFAVDLFVKQVKFDESETKDDGSVTKFSFSDKIAGVGGRFLGKGFFAKFGRAVHDAKSTEERDGENASASEIKAPNGKDAGLYFGAGVWLPLGSDLEVFGDFTRYQLTGSRYKIDEISFGARVAIGEGEHRPIGTGK